MLELQVRHIFFTVLLSEIQRANMPLPPPPVGLDLSQTQVPRIYGVNIATYLLALIAVVLRFICRRLTGAQLWWDDWLIIAALVNATILTFTSIIYMVDHGLGRHVWVGPPDAVEVWGIGLFISEITYTLTIVSVKFSILLFYWRIFKQSKIRIPIYILSTIVTCWGTAVLLISIFSCIPVDAYWKRFAGLPTDSYKCTVNTHEFFIGNSVPNIITDAAVIVLPIPFIWNLHLATAQKIAMSNIFVLGIFVTGVSITRLTVILNLDLTAPDITWNFVNTQIWTGVESHIGIVCACLPSLRPILNILVFGAVSTNSRKSTSRSLGRVKNVSIPDDNPLGRSADNNKDHLFTRISERGTPEPQTWATSDLPSQYQLAQLNENEINVTTDIQVQHHDRKK